MSVRSGREAPAQKLDDPGLLQLMLDDLEAAPSPFRVTNYWANYARRFMPELHEKGLQDFRRRRKSVLKSFGGGDFAPTLGRLDLFRSRVFWNRITRRIPGWRRLLAGATAALNRPELSPVVADFYGHSIEDLRAAAFRLVKSVGEQAGAAPVAGLEASLVGNPEDVFRIEGRALTMRTLYYYLRYAYCHRFVDFSRLHRIVELGPGVGRQVEVTKKLHPNVSFVLFDIPPQLYVCEQFLKAVFPGDVIAYRETRSWTRLGETQPGAILILGNWQFPLLAGEEVELFWDAAGFEAMEPDVVENYLRYVNASATAVYLQESMEGKELAEREGSHGVLRKTTLTHYQKGLPNFELVDVSPCWQPLGELKGYSDSFWKRRAPAKIERGQGCAHA